MDDVILTSGDVYKAADGLLKALDSAPTGTGTVLKNQASKDWMETSVLRALGKLDAASYHCSNVARAVQKAHEKTTEFAKLAKCSNKDKLGPDAVGVACMFSVREIAFEIDAFLAAARSSIDFGGAIPALHLGMDRRTSITRVLKLLHKAPRSSFDFLLAWMPWVEVLKRYRDECVHYRVLRMQTGYKAVRRKGVLAVAILPFVIPQEIGHDQPETRAARFRMYGTDYDVTEGLFEHKRWGEVNMADGSTKVLEHSISYLPAGGYMRVEEFCNWHLNRLRKFLVDMFERSPKARFSFQKQS